jgi:hypothetical protein
MLRFIEPRKKQIRFHVDLTGFTIVSLVLTGLKLADVVAWPWYVIWSPVWIPLTIALIVALIICIKRSY